MSVNFTKLSFQESCNISLFTLVIMSHHVLVSQAILFPALVFFEDDTCTGGCVYYSGCDVSIPDYDMSHIPDVTQAISAVMRAVPALQIFQFLKHIKHFSGLICIEVRM